MGKCWPERHLLSQFPMQKARVPNSAVPAGRSTPTICFTMCPVLGEDTSPKKLNQTTHLKVLGVPFVLLGCRRTFPRTTGLAAGRTFFGLPIPIQLQEPLQPFQVIALVILIVLFIIPAARRQRDMICVGLGFFMFGFLLLGFGLVLPLGWWRLFCRRPIAPR